MLRVSPEGDSLVVIAANELAWAGLAPGVDAVELAVVGAVPGAFDATFPRSEVGHSGATAEVWTIADRAKPILSRWRIAAGAAQLHGQIELAPSAGAERLIALPGWPTGAIWLGQQAQEVREIGGQLTVRELDDHTDYVVPVPPAGLVVLREGKLWLQNDAGTRLLPAAGDLSGMRVLDGGGLARDRQIALVLEREGVQTLAIVETSDGTIEQRTNFKGVVAIRVASARGHVILRRADHQLLFFDVARGRLIHTWDAPSPFVDFGVDRTARHLCLELPDARRALVFGYDDVLAGRVASRLVAPPAPVLIKPAAPVKPPLPPGRTVPIAPGPTPAAAPIATAAPTVPWAAASASAPSAPVRLTGTSLTEGRPMAKPMPAAPVASAPPAATPSAPPALTPSAPPALTPSAPPALTPSAPPAPMASTAAAPALEPPAPRPQTPAKPTVIPTLIALEPRPFMPLTPRSETLQYLERVLELIGALCEQAIAVGWDTGRISYAGTGPMPFAEEVAALLNRAHGRAEDLVKRSEARVAELEVTLRKQRAALERPEPGKPPTRLLPSSALAAEFGLSELATRILLIVAAPTIWGEISRLYAIAANDKERPICDELLICQLMAGRVTRRDIARELKPTAPLMRYGLITVGKALRPFAALTVDPALIGHLCGESYDGTVGGESAVSVRAGRTSLADIALAGGLREQLLVALGRRAEGGPVRIVLRGRMGSGRRTLLATLARLANRQLGIIDVGLFKHAKAQLPELLQGELRAALLRGWLPCVSGLDDLSADEPALRERVREVVRAYPGPLAFRCMLETNPPIDPGYLAFDIEPMSEQERGVFWTQTLAAHGLSPEPAEYLAARYRVGPGAMVQVTAQLAARLASPGGSNGHTTSAELATQLEAGLRQHRDARIAGVAQRMTRLATWDSVVLPEDVIDSIKEFISRIKYRRTVYESWGFDKVMTTSRGLTALFQGGPGTGKSMVAGIIARELGFDLYRVDMSRILSKWIGETEKNLAGVFDAAEDGQAIILFDEADALFAKRTEVKSSNDRYANIETNYLLQRLDTLEGIAILTTNLAGSIDPAFKRRMTLRLTFPFPDEEQRTELWRVHIPKELPTHGHLDLALLARKHQLSGGYIRNAVLRAAFLAAQDQSPLTQEHLERAVKLEYREMGKLAEGGILE